MSGPELAPATAALIAVNVAVFVVNVLLGGDLSGRFGGQLQHDGTLWGPAVANGEWWRVLTAGFLHFGIFHLLLNMVLLYFLGGLLEPAIGRTRFLLIYLVSLVAGSLGALLIEPGSASAGASGAGFGLMGAALVAARSRGVSPMHSDIGMLLFFNLGFTFLIPGISIGGHLGGLAGGAAAGLLLIELDETRRLFGRSVVPAAVMAALLAAGLFVAALVVAGSTG